MSTPCPGHPNITLDIENNKPLSLCPGIRICDEWRFATDGDTKYEVICTEEGEDYASAEIECTFATGKTVKTEYRVDAAGVEIKVSGDGEIAYMIPAFHFDGETHTNINLSGCQLDVSYGGAVCTYAASEKIIDASSVSANRNGHYKMYYISGNGELNISIKIINK